MQVNRDFTIEPFKSKPIFRSDKGKKHSYPKQRKRWNPICQRLSKTNLIINQTNAYDKVMSKNRKSTPAMREYWREQKRKQREKQEESKE